MKSHEKQFHRFEIPLEAIKSATNNFAESNSIGHGGFGKVYKGKLIDASGTKTTTVAVKRLHREFGQGHVEFRKEVMILCLHKHDNIVSLLGFHDGNDEKILVYEYAANGSLDSHLENQDLTWTRRLKICIGAARGLEYLHSPTTNHQRILHRDIKSSNILLDENWKAKISDFGLSKFGPANQEHTYVWSNAVGTFGYCDPVYAEYGLLTKESDVYSFGVVLFEVLCGRLNSKHGHRPLIGLVRAHYDSNNMIEIIYDKIKNEIYPDSLKEFTTIAYRCLERDREQRPSMNEVVKGLETALGNQQFKDAIKDYYDSKRKPPIRPSSYKKITEFESISEGVHYPYLQPGSSSSTPAWDFTSNNPHHTSGGYDPPRQSGHLVLEDEDEPKEWMARVEPGVQITFVSLPNGGNGLNRICFDREMFNKRQAERWWVEYYDRIIELYNVQRFNIRPSIEHTRSD